MTKKKKETLVFHFLLLLFEQKNPNIKTFMDHKSIKGVERAPNVKVKWSKEGLYVYQSMEPKNKTKTKPTGMSSTCRMSFNNRQREEFDLQLCGACEQVIFAWFVSYFLHNCVLNFFRWLKLGHGQSSWNE